MYSAAAGSTRWNRRLCIIYDTCKLCNLLRGHCNHLCLSTSRLHHLFCHICPPSYTISPVVSVLQVTPSLLSSLSSRLQHLSCHLCPPGYTISSKGSSPLAQMVRARRHRPSHARCAETSCRQPGAALCKMHCK